MVLSFLDVDSIKQDMNRTIDSGPDGYDYEFGEVCREGIIEQIRDAKKQIGVAVPTT